MLPGDGSVISAASSRQGSEADRFRILFVCTGNVCRSVIAERLARRGIRTRLGEEAARFSVTSAGTASPDGLPMHPYTTQALARLGAGTAGFRSRQLTAGHIDGADLILAACAEHRDQVLVTCPRASRRSYLLREFARLAAVLSPRGDAPDAMRRARDAVAAAAQLRGRIPYVEPAADEIADPAADPQAFLSCAQVIDGAVRAVLDVLCGSLSAVPAAGACR